MSSERGYSGREIGGVLAFAAAGILLGFGAYRAGGALSGAQGGAVVAAAPGGALPNGQALYAGNCAGCHGAQAQGGVGPSLASAAGWSAEQFSAAVLDGKAPDKTLNNVMPRYRTMGLDGAPATDAQLAALRTYLQSLK